MSLHIQTTQTISIDDLLAEQTLERGLTPLPLEQGLLLERIRRGGHSGTFLADAFLSTYRTGKHFTHSLGEITSLDAEAFRLFHQILHIRFISGWSDAVLYDLEQTIIAINGGES